ncbi:MAG: DEAD/DEAH box helicase, partial [bacterium]|nr:DEAD/DEAH box helicase [bacterium]
MVVTVSIFFGLRFEQAFGLRYKCAAMTTGKDAAALLGPGGAVARRLPNYEPRPQQLEMAQAVGEAFAASSALMVEAGTGVGKSFAYLLPAIQRVIEHGERVVISTHTIALQEQLIHKDLPFLQSVLPEPFSAVLVKGRANYLSLRRLGLASRRERQLFETDRDLAELGAIGEWAYETTDGSRSDLPRQPSPGVWESVQSDPHNCFGRRCPTYGKCFYQ